MAALLLFGKEEAIQSAVPHYKIDAIVRREDIERYDDRENIRCNLIEAYEILMNFVNRHLPDKFYMQGEQRISLREKIFREVIANLLMHREYSNAQPATFIIYKDRVEVKNANRPHLMGNLVPGRFEPFSKNPNLAKFFVQLARAEDLGTGINYVYKYLKHYVGAYPEFCEDQLFKVNLPLSPEKAENHRRIELNGELNGKLNGELNGELNERRIAIYFRIKESPGIKLMNLVDELKIPYGTADKYIRHLIDKNLIERRGSKKTGGYWIKKNNDL